MPNIVRLPSRSRVKGALVKDNDICPFIFLLDILQNGYDCGFKFVLAMIQIIQIFCLFISDGIVKDLIYGLGDLFSSCCNLVVKVIWNWQAANDSNSICRNTPRLYSHNPVVQGKNSFVFSYQLGQFFGLSSLG